MSIQYLLFTQVSDRSTVQFTVCHCPHTAGRRTFFTSTFYVQPNLIDFATIVDFTEFDLNNAAVYGTLICMLCLYVIVVAILRRKDQNDTEKVLIFMKVICCICKLSSLSLCSLHLDGFVIVGSTVPLRQWRKWCILLHDNSVHRHAQRFSHDVKYQFHHGRRRRRLRDKTDEWKRSHCKYLCLSAQCKMQWIWLLLQ